MKNEINENEIKDILNTSFNEKYDYFYGKIFKNLENAILLQSDNEKINIVNQSLIEYNDIVEFNIYAEMNNKYDLTVNFIKNANNNNNIYSIIMNVNNIFFMTYTNDDKYNFNIIKIK
jgi:hypothetical protein